MKLALITNAFYPCLPEYAGYTDRLKQEYCSAVGWEYARTAFPAPGGLPGGWSKAEAIRRALENADAVLWMDADAAPVNLQRAVEVQACIYSAGDRVVCAKDHNGWNTGVFSVSGPEGLKLFEDGLELSGKYLRHPWMEQAAFMQLEPQRPGLVIQPWPEIGWNKYDFASATWQERYRPGDFCLHLPGQPDWWRERVFGKLLEEKYKVGKHDNT